MSCSLRFIWAASAITKLEDGSRVSVVSYEDKRPLLMAWVLGRGTVARPGVFALGTTTRFLTLLSSPIAGSVHPPSTSMATSSQYRQLLSDYGPPSLGYTQVGSGGMPGTGGGGGGSGAGLATEGPRFPPSRAGNQWDR